MDEHDCHPFTFEVGGIEASIVGATSLGDRLRVVVQFRTDGATSISTEGRGFQATPGYIAVLSDGGRLSVGRVDFDDTPVLRSCYATPHEVVAVLETATEAQSAALSFRLNDAEHVVRVRVQ